MFYPLGGALWTKTVAKFSLRVGGNIVLQRTPPSAVVPDSFATCADWKQAAQQPRPLQHFLLPLCRFLKSASQPTQRSTHQEEREHPVHEKANVTVPWVGWEREQDPFGEN